MTPSHPSATIFLLLFLSCHPCHPGDPPLPPITRLLLSLPLSLQLIIWTGRPLPNDHPDQPDFSPFIFVFFSKIPIFLQHTTSSPSKNFLFKSFKLQSRGPFMLILRQIHNNFYNNYKNYEWSQMYIFDKAWVLFTSKYRFEKTRHQLVPVKDILHNPRYLRLGFNRITFFKK